MVVLFANWQLRLPSPCQPVPLILRDMHNKIQAEAKVFERIDLRFESGGTVFAFNPNNEGITLDAVGLAILNALQENARMPLAEIGRQVGLTAPAVAERVRRMEEAGIITGYHAHVDPDKLGFPVTVIVQVALNGPCTPATERRIAALKDVSAYYFVTGDNDLLIKASFRSMAQLDELLAALSSFGTPSTSIVLTHKSVPYRPMTLGPQDE